MADKLRPGTMNDFSASMAEAMQEALDAAKREHGGPLAPSDQTKLLFVAVAQGVVKHLARNPEAFAVPGGEAAGTLTSIGHDGLYYP